MQISYGDDQYLVLRVSVYDAIGETFRLATPCPFRTRMPCRWKSRDAIEGVKDFRQKLVAQARHFSVVKFDCFAQFDLRDFQKTDFHYLYFARTCSMVTVFNFPAS